MNATQATREAARLDAIATAAKARFATDPGAASRFGVSAAYAVHAVRTAEGDRGSLLAHDAETIDAEAKETFRTSPAIRAEFRTVERFQHYCRASAQGLTGMVRSGTVG